MSDNVPAYIVGHLDWPTRLRFAAGVALGLVLFGSIGYSVLQPWDLEGAISLLLAGSKVYLLVRVTAMLLAVSVLSTIIMDARLSLFGVFAAMVGLAYPVVKTAGMAGLMTRMQAGIDIEDTAAMSVLWRQLSSEMLAWAFPLVVSVAGAMLTERWLKTERILPPAGGEPKPVTTVAHRVDWFSGLLGTFVTAVGAGLLILLFCASRHKGQVIFAVSAGFFLASFAGDWISRNRHPVWQVAAVPLVGLAAFIYASWHPQRPPGVLEQVLQIAPNPLAAILPIEYICAGVASAIFGSWMSESTRHSNPHV